MGRRLKLLLALCGASAALAGALAPQAMATPFAETSPATTPEGTPVEITLHGGSDFDALVQFAIVSGPGNGSLGPIGAPSCSFSGGVTNCTAPVTYSPDPGFSGIDSFTFSVDDGTGTANGNSNVSVRPVPQLAASVVNLGEMYAATASHLLPGATVDWGDGSPEAALIVNPDGTANLGHTFSSEATFEVTITNHNGPFDDASTTPVYVVIPGLMSSNFGPVPPGTTGSLSTSGVQATLTHGASAPGAANLFLGNYGITPGPPNPIDPSAPAGNVTQTQIVDVRVTQSEAGDQLTVTFSVPPGTTFGALLFFNPATGTYQPVSGSTLVPTSLQFDPTANTVTVVFDLTSLPSLASLTGTRFAVLGKPPAPRIDRLKVKPRCSVQGRKRPVVKLSLSQAASVQVTVQRRKGSRGRNHCGPIKDHRRAPGKPSFEPPKELSESLPTGASTTRRLHLAPGAYRVRVTASNSSGTSRAERRNFVVLPHR